MAGPNVELDLDTLEREDDPGPFRIKLGGTVYAMNDPKGMGYRKLLDVMSAAAGGRVMHALGGMVPEDERESFVAAVEKDDLPLFKLEALTTGWLKHYKLSLPEASASPPS